MRCAPCRGRRLMKPIGILGGTFDPIHNGHLRLALEVYERLGLAEVRLIPLHQPPHREGPAAGDALRLEMVQAATAGVPGLTVDDRELQRGGISYTVETLASMREEFGDTPLCLILGMDAFRGLPQWHLWERLPELTHLVIAGRPSAVPPGEGPAARLLTERGTDDPAALGSQPAGRILLIPVPLLDISASGIRGMLAAGRNPRYLLPDAVLDVIRRHRLYASTEG